MEMVKVKKMFIELMAKNTGQDIKKVEQDMERNNWMTPQDALKYGLIDKIIE
jgi:ATP-dependent Clp protease protease subunit